MRNFPFTHQLDSTDCGSACLVMIAKFYGKAISLKKLRDSCFTSREGVSLLDLSDAAESIGFRTIAASISLRTLIEESPLPLIAHWKNQHYVVVYRTTKKKIYVADPAFGFIKFTPAEFIRGWQATPSVNIQNNGSGATGRILLLEPTNRFYDLDNEPEIKYGFKSIFGYLNNYKKLIIQLCLGILLGIMLQLFLPFLTQSIVDIGINQRNIDFLYLILLGQVALFTGQTSLNILRSWILVHINSRVSISLVAEFLMKLMRLPMSFFNSKMTGDILKRIDDHQKIERFLTNTVINIFSAVITVSIFSIVLALYNFKIFAVFFVGSLIFTLWVILFMKKRRNINYKNFALESENQNSILQLVAGIQEIKLSNCEKKKRWEWETIRAGIFRNQIKSLALEQYQNFGGLFLNEIKNVTISVIAALSVINGEITMGMMLAIQFIIGQLNTPILQLIGFLQNTQDAKISLERLGEILEKKDEVTSQNYFKKIPEEGTITLRNLVFSYGSTRSPKILNKINVEIPANKITAIVGPSGSGKTTLLKLLLRLHEPTEGEILFENYNLTYVHNDLWRQKCGAVMQDGYIFSDTIANNIALSDETVDHDKLIRATRIANIHDFIETLPLGYNTKIGSDGINLSQGQKQRLLIARVVYKNPRMIFLDEATNSLDANNETTILNNLNQFLSNRTVVVVAHRLSTIQKADQIIVLEDGMIKEMGSHAELLEKKGSYYTLVKKQLHSLVHTD
ncbi:peptidase domain-containing ABC transporter [Chryseolinea sp. H1M3-3]|uniref:peptidase domain-containing ABC transporter n=1 Tax=Chryseolinea sp. H1M3-3 TaxID=3034144 RepID=UPI0023ED5EAF|nr:peptidase domain-containing ABC transporter [Chryseolinea sp. H1M3-3]